MTFHGDTWRAKSGTASWAFRLAQSTAAYRLLVTRFLHECRGFAVPAIVRLATRRDGENALVVDVRDKEQYRRLAAFMDARDDVEDAEISLDLTYESAEGKEHLLHGGATVWLSPECEAHDDHRFWLVVTLHTDLYAFVSWGRNRDNTAVAKRNAPRMETFLRRLEEELGFSLAEIDAPSYQDQAYRYGFRPPGSNALE